MRPRRHTRIGRLAILAALGAGALLPAGAFGSTASISFGEQLDFSAAAGETNSLTIGQAGTNYVLTDPGSTITPGTGCAAVNANQVTCSAAGVFDASINLNDLNDSGTITASFTAIHDGQATVAGGAGIDTLTNSSLVRFTLLGDDQADLLIGGPASDRLIGGADNDVSIGNGGSDRFDEGLGIDTSSGGAGNDQFSNGGAPDGSDSFSGGEGTDEISYQSRSDVLSVTLDDVANDGSNCPGAGCENDNARADIENIQGGGKDDVLTGSASANRIDGVGGNDTIVAGAGDDDLAGGGGDDSVAGEAGDDVIRGDEGADRLDGGDGDDELRGELEDLSADVLVGGTGIDSTSAFARGGAIVTLDGVADDGARDPTITAPKDNLSADIENLVAGDGDDILIGSDAANEIEGGGGDDQIIGAGGADGLIGADGADTIDGGAEVDSILGGSGADSLRSRDRAADQIDCGSSIDTLLADAKDDPEPSCDRTSRGLVIAKKAKLSAGRVALEVSCPAAEGVDCKAKLKLAKGKKTVASGKSKIKSGKTKTVKLKAKGLGGGQAKLEASGSFKDASGEQVTTRQKVTVG